MAAPSSDALCSPRHILAADPVGASRWGSNTGIVDSDSICGMKS